MKLETGMYARYGNNQIGKIKTISNNVILVGTGGSAITFRELIKKASFDIIDLIEVGDYVNKHLVTEVYLSGERKYIKLDNSYANGEGIRIYEENIKTVVTHEQFKNVEYRIEGK